VDNQIIEVPVAVVQVVLENQFPALLLGQEVH
jgi:hypothetical protein